MVKVSLTPDHKPNQSSVFVDITTSSALVSRHLSKARGFIGQLVFISRQAFLPNKIDEHDITEICLKWLWLSITDPLDYSQLSIKEKSAEYNYTHQLLVHIERLLLISTDSYFRGHFTFKTSTDHLWVNVINTSCCWWLLRHHFINRNNVFSWKDDLWNGLG